MKLRLLLLLSLMACKSLLAQQLNFKEIVLPEAVRTSSLDLLYTDREGFLWLASGSNVYQYDGLQFKPVTTDTTARAGDRISAIYQDGEARVWLGWRSGHISLVSGDTTIAYKPEEGTPATAIVGWTEDTGGQLWMATKGEGLYVRDGNNRWHNFNTDDGLPSNDAYDLESFQNEIILATDQGLVKCRLSSEGKKDITLIDKSDGLADQIVKDIFFDGNDLWLGFYEPHINRLSKQGEIIPEKEPPGDDAHLVLRSGQTTWWLSEAGHLYRSTTNRSWQQVEIKTLRRTHIRHLALDNEGHLWVSTNHGLFLLDQWMETYPTERSITALWVNDSLLWFSQEGDIFKMNMANRSTKKVVEGENLILNLYGDVYGRVWAGTFDGGALVWDTRSKQKRLFNETAGLVNNNVLSIDGNDKGVWLGTLGGVGFIPFGKNGEIGPPQSYSHIEGVGVPYIYSVHVTQAGEVYLATDGDGVLHWDGEFFRPLSVNLPTNVVLDIASGRKGRLWWITPDARLHSWSRQEGARDIKVFNQEPGRVAGLLTEKSGDVLVFHEGGFHRWNVDEENWVTYGKSFGLGSFQPELHAQCIDENNFLYSGTPEGLTSLSLNLLPSQPKPSTHLKSVQLFFEPTSSFEFTAGENHLTFNYIGRWYTDPESVRYKLKLQGYDLDWAISQNTSVTYPQLPPGDYTFLVVAGIDGHFPKEEQKEYSFTILSPWYSRWYVITLTILLLALLGYLLGRWRLRQIHEKQQQEQERVRAQYEALKSQVNPHFLFNSFNTLMALIEDDREEASQYLSELSDFFRNILQFREIDLIPVEEELKIVKTYLSLQEKRFGINLQVEIVVEPLALDTLIPPLTLQLLVENVFKHNVISRLKPLKLRIYSKSEKLVVWNVLQEKSQRDPSTGYGLDSIRKKYLYHTKSEVHVELTENHFAVHLPLILKKPD